MRSVRGMRARHMLAIGALVVLGACATKPLPSDPSATRQQVCDHAAMGKIAGGSAREDAIKLALERGFVRGNQVELIRENKVAIGMNTCEVLAAWGNPVGAETFTNEHGKTTTYWYKAAGRMTHTVRFDAEGVVYWMSNN
jgi:outer membrane protein assembly factor BamE (lipoprotein component of BamABCDE complex)